MTSFRILFMDLVAHLFPALMLGFKLLPGICWRRRKLAIMGTTVAPLLD
jgi:hypothetical protein